MVFEQLVFQSPTKPYASTKGATMSSKEKKLTIDKRPLRAITDEQELKSITGGSWSQKPAWGQVPIWRKKF